MVIHSWGRRAFWICAVALLALLSSSSAHSDDDKKADRTSGPWNLETLRRPPKVTIIEKSKTVTALYYEGEPYKGNATRVFAYLARPERSDGKLPAMVLVHGGGGKAFKQWAELWAKRGYVALAMDLAGHGGAQEFTITELTLVPAGAVTSSKSNT